MTEKTDLAEAVGIVLMPPHHEPEITEEQRALLDRIERLERKFLTTESGKRRHKIRTLIEALEGRLELDALREHNRYLLTKLMESHDAQDKLKREMDELGELWRKMREEMQDSVVAE